GEILGSLIPSVAGAEWQDEKVGLISFSMDGSPILGPVSDHPGLFIGLAFHSGGFAYNPVAGELLAEYTLDGSASIDVSAFSPDRFQELDTQAYLAASIAQS